MNVEYRRELRGIILVSLFIMVIPLILFPRDFGLNWNSSLFLHFTVELGWYTLILYIALHRPSAQQMIACIMLTLVYRIVLGLGFTLFLMIMLSQSLSSALTSGVYQFTPAFIIQAFISPFVLKSILGGFMKKTEKEEQEPTQLPKIALDAFSLSPPQGRILTDKLTGRGMVAGEKELKITRVDNLESILHYIKEYSGVKAALLVDEEGLVVAGDASSDQDTETVASYALCLKEVNDQVLEKMGGKSSERINIHTSALWISLNQIDRFLLVVVADNSTGELLSVRIMQSLLATKRFLAEKYQENILKAVEG